MGHMHESTRQLQANIANVLSKYRTERLFRIDDLTNDLKRHNFPYQYKKHYLSIRRFLEDLCSRDLLELDLKTQRKSQRYRYKILDSDKLNQELKHLIDEDFINSKVIYVRNTEAKPAEPESTYKYVAFPEDKNPPSTKQNPPEEVKPEPEPEPDPQEIVRDNQCLLECLEYMADAVRNEFTVEDMYDELYVDGFDITLREVRKNVASLSKDNIVKVLENDHKVHKIVLFDQFYKRLDHVRREECKRPPPSYNKIQVGESVVAYTNNVKLLLDQTKLELEKTREELEFYKEQEKELDQTIEEIKHENVRLSMLVTKAGLDKNDTLEQKLELKDLT